MKKILSLLLALAVIICAVSCTPAGYESTLADATLEYKLVNAQTSGKATYYVTPTKLDLNDLASKGYNVEIEVSYEISYDKRWGIDAGYTGAPKYDVTILDKNGVGVEKNGEVPEKNPETNSIVYTASASDLKDNRVILTFSTINIQNTLYLKNINVKYKCVE